PAGGQGVKKEGPGASFIARPLPQEQTTGRSRRIPALFSRWQPDSNAAYQIAKPRIDFCRPPRPCWLQAKRQTPPPNRRAASSHCQLFGLATAGGSPRSAATAGGQTLIGGWAGRLAG